MAAALQRRWFFAPGIIITAGCIISIISFGVRSSMGLFTHPISEAYQWNREVYGLAMAIQNLVWGIMQPIAGAMADRFGPAKVVATGAVIYALGTALMSFADTPALMYLAGGVLVGAGIATASFSIVMAAFGRLVPPEKRSWVFGLATSAGSLGQFIFAPLGHPSFVLLVLGFFVCGFQLAFVTIHLPAYLVEHGISEWLAASAIAIVGIFNVIGSYCAGIIGGKYRKRISLAMIYLLRSLFVILFLMTPVTPLSTVVFTASMGLLWLSTVPLTMGLVMVMFGTRYIATLYGFVFLSHQVGSFFGVWLGGKFHDLYGSYDPVWWMGVALGLFAALVHWPIREERAPAFAV